MYYPYAGNNMQWEYELCRQNQIPMEEWRKVTEREIPYIQDYYWVSNYGNVWSEVLRSYMTFHIDDKGYSRLHLKLLNGEDINIGVHRLEMLVFDYRPDHELFIVNHKDGIKNHNWLWNLEWATQKENVQHAVSMGLKPIGSKVHNALFTDEEVHAICKMLEEGVPYSEIISKLGLQNRGHYINSEISDIKSGRLYKHISSQYNIYPIYDETRTVFSDEEVNMMCKMMSEKNVSYLEILNALGYDINNLSDQDRDKYKRAISRIKLGDTRTDISSNYAIIGGRSDRAFTDEQVHIICKELLKGTSYEQILNIIGYNTSNMDQKDVYNLKNNIIRIGRGISYKHISSQYNFANAPSQKRNGYHFDDNEMEYIIKMIKENPNMGNKQILLSFKDISGMTNGEVKKLTDAISYIRRFKINKT